MDAAHPLELSILIQLIDKVRPDKFESYIEHLGYIGILLWYTTVDQLTPIPEEITLLTIGYLAANNVFNPIIAGAVAFFAFIIVDLAYYLLARSGHKLVEKINFLSGI